MEQHLTVVYLREQMTQSTRLLLYSPRRPHDGQEDEVGSHGVPAAFPVGGGVQVS